MKITEDIFISATTLKAESCRWHGNSDKNQRDKGFHSATYTDACHKAAFFPLNKMYPAACSILLKLYHCL